MDKSSLLNKLKEMTVEEFAEGLEKETLKRIALDLGVIIQEDNVAEDAEEEEKKGDKYKKTKEDLLHYYDLVLNILNNNLSSQNVKTATAKRSIRDTDENS